MFSSIKSLELLCCWLVGFLCVFFFFFFTERCYASELEMSPVVVIQVKFLLLITQAFC